MTATHSRVRVWGRLAALFAASLIFGLTAAADKKPPAKPNAAAVQPAGDGSKDELHLLKVQGNIYMLVGAGGNITVQVGKDGVLLVDTGLTPMAEKVIAAYKSLSDRPLRYIVNTHLHADHTGGNETVAKSGMTVAGGNVVSDIGASAANQAQVVAFQTVLDHMSGADGKDKPTAQGAWPTETYTTPERHIYFNDEGIQIIHIPNAHTDGDSMVFFRKSDVISTGDLFVTNHYPIVDLAHGGNIQGVIAALNRIIDIAIPADLQEDGTLIIPGHGRLCDVADVVFYQEMVTIIRDRVQDMINKGMTLEQVQAAKPTRDYDPRYGATSGIWTTEQFVAAVYKSLSPKK